MLAVLPVPLGRGVLALVFVMACTARMAASRTPATCKGTITNRCHFVIVQPRSIIRGNCTVHSSGIIVASKMSGSRGQHRHASSLFLAMYITNSGLVRARREDHRVLVLCWVV